MMVLHSLHSWAVLLLNERVSFLQFLHKPSQPFNPWLGSTLRLTSKMSMNQNYVPQDSCGLKFET